jgi:hypothetical protein
MVETNQHFFIKYSNKNMNTGSKYQQQMSFGAHLSKHKKQILIKVGISILQHKSGALISGRFVFAF